MKGLGWMAAGVLVVWMGASSRPLIAPLESALRATGAAPAGYSLNAWAKLAPTAARASLTALLERLAESAHLAGPVSPSSGPGFRKESLETRVAGITTRLIVERLAGGATYAVLDRVSTQNFYGLGESRDLFAHVLSRLGSPHMAITLEGTVPGQRSPAERAALVREAFSAVGATRVNGISTAHYLAAAGYTPAIAQADQLAGQPVNIQVAVTYNTYLHRTQIDIGSPLVTVTY